MVFSWSKSDVITLAICSAMIGSILGIRFRSAVLLPFIFVGSVSLIAFALAHDQALLQSVAMIGVFVSLLQLGYFCTALLRHAVTPALAAGERSLLESPKLR
jgi:hypothetical protein